MTKSLLIARKDLAILFRSPLAYVVMACFLVVTGSFFVVSVRYFEALSMEAMRMPEVGNFTLMELVIGPHLQSAAVILLFFIPLVTMRSFSEEKRMGSFELLMSYPVREWEVAAGKLLALAGFLGVAILVSMLAPAQLFFVADPELAPLLVGHVGLFLMAMSFAALGLFLSSLTESQIVAAVLTFAALLLIWALAWLEDIVPTQTQTLLAELSLIGQLDPFTRGVLEVKSLVYFLTFIGGCFWLTTLSLENQRWRT